MVGEVDEVLGGEIGIEVRLNGREGVEVGCAEYIEEEVTKYAKRDVVKGGTRVRVGGKRRGGAAYTRGDEAYVPNFHVLEQFDRRLMRLPQLLNLHLFLTTLFPFPLTFFLLPLSPLPPLLVTNCPILPMMLYIRVFWEDGYDGSVWTIVF